ncbi:two pore domain potassium channel family protein [Bacillus sp. FJAT-49736]|uniref:two pore domain potassium channel family protein n=1 Tax=Bacillus sp. FJAT-49736 TaxID=2833582 RepID=UPI001BC9041B|nr:two pore domain potassium channel family protein [Bacillus sp. FJAT-49736]MBS4175176.1 two pore domain potassium channel family protein [Bacillus sp. FJAT-49736]
MYNLLIVLVILCICMSLRTLFFSYKLKNKQISFDNFLFLAFAYCVLMIGFGLIFLLLEIKGFNIIMDHGSQLEGSYFHKLYTSVYLSAVTLFSVGFGDVVPLGIGRVIVIMEALIGYTIPAAFVVKSVLDFDQVNIKKK